MIEILGILVEILGFLFEILTISKICDNRIPYQWCRSSFFVVNCEHISNFVLIVDFEKFAWFILKRQTLLIGHIMRYVVVF